MNIFVLDTNPKLAAQYHCDKHVVKMITETCQILSTAIQEIGTGPETARLLYKPTHVHHPCVKFITDNPYSMVWLNNLLSRLLDEYDYRFEKPDKFVKARDINILVANYIARNPYNYMSVIKWDSWPQCMPDEYHNKSIVKAYRAYYKGGKSHLLKYTKRKPPVWLNK